MGSEVIRAVHADPDCELVAALDVSHPGEDAGVLAGVGPLGVPIQAELPSLIAAARPAVLVDFTRADAAVANAATALRHRVSPVVGTTGFSEAHVAELHLLAAQAGVGAFIAPNFAIGAVLMMIFARQAARHLPEVEIIELHHAGKVDAPSGTAMRTARLILENRGPRTLARPPREEFQLEAARGGDLEGIRIHSVRLPGYVAHQEVIFGGQGQTLTIRHDSTDRTSFMPGVLLAVKRVRSLPGLVVGLENLLD
jgi:4-hydroxy-tetrahydrodipicolinate reductase